MNIHGSVYLISGILLLGVSYYVSSISQTQTMQKFMLFILIGIAFCLIGAFKLLRSYIANRSQRKGTRQNSQQAETYTQGPNFANPMHPHYHTHNPQMDNSRLTHPNAHQNTAAYLNPHHQNPHNQINSNVQHPANHHAGNQAHAARHPNLKYCARCHAPHRQFDKFCYKCGNRSFH